MTDRVSRSPVAVLVDYLENHPASGAGIAPDQPALNQIRGNSEEQDADANFVQDELKIIEDAPIGEIYARLRSDGVDLGAEFEGLDRILMRNALSERPVRNARNYNRPPQKSYRRLAVYGGRLKKAIVPFTIVAAIIFCIALNLNVIRVLGEERKFQEHLISLVSLDKIAGLQASMMADNKKQTLEINNSLEKMQKSLEADLIFRRLDASAPPISVSPTGFSQVYDNSVPPFGGYLAYPPLALSNSWAVSSLPNGADIGDVAASWTISGQPEVYISTPPSMKVDATSHGIIGLISYRDP